MVLGKYYITIRFDKVCHHHTNRVDTVSCWQNLQWFCCTALIFQKPNSSYLRESTSTPYRPHTPGYNFHPKDSGNHLDYCSSDVTVYLRVWLTPDKLFPPKVLTVHVMGLCERHRNFALNIDFYLKITAKPLLTGAFFKLNFEQNKIKRRGEVFVYILDLKNWEIFHDFHFWHNGLFHFGKGQICL